MKTLKQLLPWYLELPEVLQLSSYKTRIPDLQKACLFIGLSRRIDMVKSIDCLRYQKRMLKTGYKPATINRHMSYLCHMFKKAALYGFGDANPLYVSRLNENNTRERMLSSDEVRLLVSNCHNMLKDLVFMANNTPMRKMELLTLTWSEVTLIRSAPDNIFGYINLKADKTKKKYSRVVPLHPKVVNLLYRRKKDMGLVFPYYGGKQIPTTFLQDEFKKAVKRSRIGDFVFHDLRHCAANNMRLAGNELSVIMAAGGWKTVKSLERYLFISEEEVKQVKWR